jgi:hypothetical protein
VDEVDVYTVDLGDELRQRVQPLRNAPEVVLVEPVAADGLQGRRLNALRAVGDELLAWPARRSYAPAQVVDPLLRNSTLNGRIPVPVSTAVLIAGLPWSRGDPLIDPTPVDPPTQTANPGLQRALPARLPVGDRDGERSQEGLAAHSRSASASIRSSRS